MKKVIAWDGVRNYQARNFIRDKMRRGDLVLIYHSSTKDPAVVGVGKVISLAYPDKTQFQKGSFYFDRKASENRVIWSAIDISFIKKNKNWSNFQRLRKIEP